MQKIVDQLKPLIPYRTIPVLLYHQIDNPSKEKDPNSLSITSKVFDGQLKVISDKLFKCICLQETETIKKDTARQAARVLFLTFDDGYLGVYQNAFPLLLKYKFTATIFLATSYVGKTSQWGKTSIPIITWAQIREMKKHGFSFQSHSCTHPDLTKIEDKQVLTELHDSKKKIEDEVGATVDYFAYPFGRYSQRIMDSVKDAGYLAAYADSKTNQGRFCRERINILVKDKDYIFKLKTSYWASWVRRIIK